MSIPDIKNDYTIKPEIVFGEGPLRWSYECNLCDGDYTIFGYVAIKLEDDDYMTSWRLVECNGMLYDADGKAIRTLDGEEITQMEYLLEKHIDWDDLIRADSWGKEYD